MPVPLKLEAGSGAAATSFTVTASNLRPDRYYFLTWDGRNPTLCAFGEGVATCRGTLTGAPGPHRVALERRGRFRRTDTGKDEIGSITVSVPAPLSSKKP